MFSKQADQGVRTGSANPQVVMGAEEIRAGDQLVKPLGRERQLVRSAEELIPQFPRRGGDTEYS
jgi:hypothetical protein